MCSLYIYTISERKVYLKGHRKVYNIFSEDKQRKQTITFFATTDNYNSIFHYKYKLDTATYNFFQ